jgi:ATP-binding cassette subfamily B protein/subfamily B ATP-binding cassette protein MsbA
MSNFFKAIRESLHLAPVVGLATLCSIGIALLWGGNITALAPVIEITLSNQSIQSWVEKREDELNREIEALETHKQNTAIEDKKTQSEITEKLNAAKESLGWRRWQLGWANAILPSDPFLTICFIMGLLVLSTLVKHLLMLSSDLLLAYASTTTVRELRRRIFDKAMRMDKVQYQAVGTSGLLSSITYAADGLAAGLIAMFGIAIREPLRVIACLALACCISWRLLFLSIVLAPLLVATVVYFNRKIRSVATSILGRNAGFHEVLLEALGNVFTVQAFTMENHERSRFAECTKHMQKLSMKMTFYTGLSKPFMELVGIGMVAITVCAGAYLVVNKETHIFFIQIRESPLSVSELLIFFGLLVGASDPLRKLSGVSVTIYNASISSNLLYGILESMPTVAETAKPVDLAGNTHKLSIKNVSFHYDPSHPVLDQIDLEIPFGRTVVLLGPNGSGKSTLINLLSRFYDPVAGQIALGGVNTRELSLHDLRRRMAIVSQSTELFNRTVFENIQYGSPEASRQEVEDAARLAHAHDFITRSLHAGYDTVVGQGGQKLSGGQRQRIALARAILRKPEILILDESTSQIDMESELQIRETLQQMKGSMTIIIITHREALTALADEVYTIQNGRLIPSQHKLAAA